jgi:hemolysin activation/secretion protein
MPAKEVPVVSASHRLPGVVALTLAALLVPRAALAQAAPAPIADPLQPERTIERLQRERQRGAPPALPSLERAASSADRKPILTLRAVALRGARTLPPQTLTPAYQRFVGRSVSAADLSTITEALTQSYRDAGYHLSRAIIQPQNAEGGRLVINVSEGAIVEVSVRGGQANSEAVRALLAPVTQEMPSRRGTLERALLLASDLPGVRVVDTRLEEIGTTSGRFRLIVEIESWRIYNSIAFDNRGSNAVGPYQSYSATNFNSAFTPGDTLGAAVSTTPSDPDQLRFGRVTYSAPVGNDGARWSLLALHSDVRPGDIRREFDTRSRADFAELRGTIAPLRGRDSSLWLSLAAAAGEYREHDVFGPVYSDHLRIVTASADYQLRDAANGWNYLTVNVKQGLDILGASSAGDPFVSRGDASGQFTKVEAYYSRIQALAGPWSLKLAAVGQWASRPLLASQQFYLGGAFGRGFYGLDVSGDMAAGGSAELRFDHALNLSFLKGYQLYGYIDHTDVWNAREDVGAIRLTLAGVGVRFDLPYDLQGTVELARPLDFRTPLPQPHKSRVLFNVAKAFKLCPGSVQLACS